MDPHYTTWDPSYFPPAYHYPPQVETAHVPVYREFCPENTENRQPVQNSQQHWPNFSHFPPNSLANFGDGNGFSGSFSGQISGSQPVGNYVEPMRNAPGKAKNEKCFEWMKPKRQQDAPCKKQTTFSKYQSMELEKEYLLQNYLTPTTKVEIAKRLQITEHQAKTWFQNRRMKEKRIQGNKRFSNESSTTPDSN